MTILHPMLKKCALRSTHEMANINVQRMHSRAREEEEERRRFPLLCWVSAQGDECQCIELHVYHCLSTSSSTERRQSKFIWRRGGQTKEGPKPPRGLAPRGGIWGATSYPRIFSNFTRKYVHVRAFCRWEGRKNTLTLVILGARMDASVCLIVMLLMLQICQFLSAENVH